MRVGFEDNIYYRRGELAKSNAELVERAARIGRELGCEILTPAETRQVLNMPPLRLQENQGTGTNPDDPQDGQP